MQLKKREVLGIYSKLQMKVRLSSGDIIAKMYYNNKLVVHTKLSHGSGDVEGKIPHLIRNQFHLNENQFQELKDCSLGLQELIKIYQDKKYI